MCLDTIRGLLFFLYNKLDICKLFHQAHNDDLPELNAL